MKDGKIKILLSFVCLMKLLLSFIFLFEIYFFRSTSFKVNGNDVYEMGKVTSLQKEHFTFSLKVLLMRFSIIICIRILSFVE